MIDPVLSHNKCYLKLQWYIILISNKMINILLLKTFVDDQTYPTPNLYYHDHFLYSQQSKYNYFFEYFRNFFEIFPEFEAFACLRTYTFGLPASPFVWKNTHFYTPLPLLAHILNECSLYVFRLKAHHGLICFFFFFLFSRSWNVLPEIVFFHGHKFYNVFT